MEETKVLNQSDDRQNVTCRHAGKKGLTSTDICEIIKACYNSNVSKLNYRDLSIEFTAHHTETIEGSHQAIYNTQETTKQEDLPNEEVEAELDLLKITDPAAYERYVTEEH